MVAAIAAFSPVLWAQDLTTGLEAYWSFDEGSGARLVWSLAAMVALIVVFGAGFVGTWDGLARHRAVQKGDWTLYPWEVFRDEIEAERPREILVSASCFEYKSTML